MSRIQPSTDEPLSNKVVTEVAAFKGVSPIDLHPPLFDAINPEALDSLFGDRNGISGGQVSFRYNGCDVTVESNGQVDVQSRDKELSSESTLNTSNSESLTD